jgi:hypothetical protein
LINQSFSAVQIILKDLEGATWIGLKAAVEISMPLRTEHRKLVTTITPSVF